MTIKHATIVPLIGGLTIAQDIAFGQKTDHLMSWSPFAANDSHLLNWYKDSGIPYYVLDRDEKPTERATVVGSVCPCSGLSQLSSAHGTHNPNNQWLIKATSYMLEEYRPSVFLGGKRARSRRKDRRRHSWADV